jgi:hypothetical protein
VIVHTAPTTRRHAGSKKCKQMPSAPTKVLCHPWTVAHPVARHMQFLKQVWLSVASNCTPTNAWCIGIAYEHPVCCCTAHTSPDFSCHVYNNPAGLLLLLHHTASLIGYCTHTKPQPVKRQAVPGCMRTVLQSTLGLSVARSKYTMVRHPATCHSPLQIMREQAAAGYGWHSRQSLVA